MHLQEEQQAQKGVAGPPLKELADEDVTHACALTSNQLCFHTLLQYYLIFFLDIYTLLGPSLKDPVRL